MAETRVQRRLAAILAADVVGYSRLMGEDEAGTLKELKALRAGLVEPAIRTHRGRMVKVMGDGALIEFPSAVDAVECAIAIQRDLAARNADTPGNRRIDFRIGINLGDIIIEGKDIYGDGVNIAARLEGLAEPGTVCISEKVHAEVRNRIDASFRDLGPQSFKNIAEPVTAYQIAPAAPSAVTEPAAAANATNPATGEKATDGPSIAVLPFDNMSGDPDHEFFGDGLAEDIITALSKVPRMTVIARNSTFVYKGRSVDVRDVARDLGVRYVLEGSVRKSASRMRVTAQLIDATTGNHIWAERYDRSGDDIFDIQDEMTKEVVTALRIELTEGETAGLVSAGTRNVEAWGLCLAANEIFDRWSSADNQRTRALAEKAVALDPDYGYAWTLLGVTYWYESRISGDAGNADLLARAGECIDKSLALDPTHPLALGMNGILHLSLGAFDTAVAEARKGVAFNPGSAEARASLGFTLAHTNRPDEAITSFDDAIRLNPHHPLWYLPVMARAYDGAGRMDEAKRAIEATLAREAENFPAHLHTASLAARTGNMALAREAVTKVRRMVPSFSTTQARQWMICQNGPFLDTYLDGLRRAGLPE